MMTVVNPYPSGHGIVTSTGITFHPPIVGSELIFPVKIPLTYPVPSPDARLQHFDTSLVIVYITTHYLLSPCHVVPGIRFLNRMSR